MISREEKLARKRAYAKRVYLERKAKQVCITCEAELVDGESVRCSRCEKRDIDGKHRRRQTEHGRQMAHARNERDRAKRVARGQCMYCTKPLAPDQKRRCADHARVNREYQRAYRARSKVLALVPSGPPMPTIGARTEVVAITVAARAPFRTKRATPKVQHKILTPVTVTIPDGWTIESDIREELLALSELVALRKVG